MLVYQRVPEMTISMAQNYGHTDFVEANMEVKIPDSGTFGDATNSGSSCFQD